MLRPHLFQRIHCHRFNLHRFTHGLTACALALGLSQAVAGTGFTRLATDASPVTVLYPSDAPEQPIRTGWMHTPLAQDGPPAQGNGRLVVISHGSGGGPWVHLDLARRLVAAGFVVAFPQHHRDHSGDSSDPGPNSWSLRPDEVRQAIDAVLADGRWGGLDARRVGLYGGSAGGHTALSLAGGRWSPARFERHCNEHLDEDFAACSGLYVSLKGNGLDGLKRWGVRRVIQWRFASDERLREDHDPRIGAIVAAVPFAADFDPDSLQQPRVPLGLVNALQDRWLKPRFHGLRVAQACVPCEDLGTLPDAGHSAMLSPLPPLGNNPLGDLLSDPSGFDREHELPQVDARIVAFFQRHLLP
ncbi:dienelactone hydrolase [Hydrogenophaga sp.]|uniref:alpha/beta hydrolase family protein n=1 Tax=Hydrogenophaga sp. TaxID=1904254 RepID=UPI002721691A|nr:dienelactone hydrolase [Hydrogenophaga sp.]MDO8903054.1 dienelactone hydrolase [Hydrogenophaga sp.]